MDSLKQALNEYVLEPENPETNYGLGVEYYNIGQTAAAVSYLLRTAERTENKHLAYECLLLIGICFELQGNRDSSVRSTYKHAICLLPSRPEAYFLLGRFNEMKGAHVDCYMNAVAGLTFSTDNNPKLRSNVTYPGKFGLLFIKAVSSWWWGRTEESKKLFLDLYKNYFDIMDEVHKNAVVDNMNRLGIEYRKNKRIFDCFRFFNEKELLELRYNMLKDYVDKFIILQGTKTFSGKPTELLAEKFIQELNLPTNKFVIINVELPGNEEKVINSQIDIIFRSFSGKSNDTYQNSLNARTRERLLLDGLLSISSQFHDNDVFFVSDCDEIIKPKLIEYFADMALKNQDKLIKIPLVELQGKADLRAYYYDSNEPATTDNVFFICTKKHLEHASPTQFRYNINNPYETVYITEDGKRLEECGWHFSWIGDKERLKLKQKSTSHYADQIESTIIKDMDSKELQDFIDNWKPEIDGINPWGYTKYILKDYPLNKLPKQIFDSEKLKSFFLSNPVNSKIPVIGVPIVNGINWLKRLIDSIDYPVEELFIVDNNGRGQLIEELDQITKRKYKYIDRIKVTHLPSNIGCSGAWNLIIKLYLNSPYWVIVNNDVAFSPGLLEKMQKEAVTTDYGMIHAKRSDWGGGSYDLFLLKDWVVEKCGLFDENLYPCYAEDVDYHIRIRNESIKYNSIDIEYLHGEKDYETSGSQTWRIEQDLKEKFNTSRILNETEYLNRKWGNNLEYSKPFNNQSYDSKYTRYDLNFNRKKYLGF